MSPSGTGVGHVHQLNALAVEVHGPLGLEERVGGPRRKRRGGLPAGRRAHRGEHVLVRDDERLRHGALDGALAHLPGEVARHQLRAGRRDRRVATGEVGIGVRVDDVADRPGAGPAAHHLEEARRVGLRERVDEQHALRTRLQQHVAAAIGNHRHLPAHRQRFELVGLARHGRGGRHGHGDRHQRGTLAARRPDRTGTNENATHGGILLAPAALCNLAHRAVSRSSGGASAPPRPASDGA